MHLSTTFKGCCHDVPKTDSCSFERQAIIVFVQFILTKSARLRKLCFQHLFITYKTPLFVIGKHHVFILLLWFWTSDAKIISVTYGWYQRPFRACQLVQIFISCSPQIFLYQRYLKHAFFYMSSFKPSSWILVHQTEVSTDPSRLGYC